MRVAVSQITGKVAVLCQNIRLFCLFNNLSWLTTKKIFKLLDTEMASVADIPACGRGGPFKPIVHSMAVDVWIIQRARAWAAWHRPIYPCMMVSWHGNSFRVTGHLCGEFTSHRWKPCTKDSDAELLCFLKKKTIEKTMVRLVMWDVIPPIITSLKWTALVSASEVYFAIRYLLNIPGIWDMDK